MPRRNARRPPRRPDGGPGGGGAEDAATASGGRPPSGAGDDAPPRRGRIRRWLAWPFPDRAAWRALGRPLGAATFFALMVRLAFPPFDLVGAGFAGLVLLMWYVGKKRRYMDARVGFWFFFAFAFVFYYACAAWLNTLTRFNVFVPLGIPIVIAYLAAWAGLAGAATGWCARRAPAWTVLVAPVAWTLSELGRSTTDFSFAFFLLGHLGVRQPEFLPGLGVELYSLLAVAGCAFVAVAMNRWWAIGGFTTRRDGIVMLGALAAIVVPCLLLHLHARRELAPDLASTRTLRLALVQPDILQERNFTAWEDPAEREAIRARVFDLAGRVGRGDVDLLVFAESTFPGYLDAIWSNVSLVRELGALVARLDASVVFSDGNYAAIEEGGRRRLLTFNSTFLIRPDDQYFAARRVYDKRRLVPYGEALPGVGWIPGVRDLFGIGVFDAGTSATALRDHAGRAVGQLVCFESAYPGLVEDTLRDGGADLFTVATNDAWFGRTSALEFHFVHAIFRAFEVGVPVVQAGNTGITGTIDPLRRRIVTLAPHAPGVLVTEVLLPATTRRLPPWPSRTWRLVGLLGALAVLGSGACLLESRRGRATLART